MNDNTILRIKVPAHLYESVKKQLTLKESKKKLSEAITGTEEEIKAFYLRAKQIEAEGTDIDSAIQNALFDINNPDAAKELSSPMNEAKKGGHNYGAGMEVVKEKKLPKKGMEKVEEVGGGRVPSTNPSDMGIDIVDEPGGIVTKEAKSSRSLEELMKAKKHLEKKINEMEMDSKNKVEEGMGVELAWIPGAIAAGLIAKTMVDEIKKKMKEENLTGIKGFIQAYKEVGGKASSAIDQSMTGGTGGIGEKKEKKVEDK